MKITLEGAAAGEVDGRIEKGGERGRRGGGRERYVEWTLSPWGADHPAAANKGRPDLGVSGCWARAPRLGLPPLRRLSPEETVRPPR